MKCMENVIYGVVYNDKGNQGDVRRMEMSLPNCVSCYILYQTEAVGQCCWCNGIFRAWPLPPLLPVSMQKPLLIETETHFIPCPASTLIVSFNVVSPLLSGGLNVNSVCLSLCLSVSVLFSVCSDAWFVSGLDPVMV